MVAQARTAPARLIPMSQACDRLAVNDRTIRRWIAEGRLTGYRLGPRLIRLDGDEIEAMLQPIPTTGGGAA